ncbi:SUMF1/EgtB/PvdO family nonheme iron enzyme [candidate division KSB1 bacterium]|nr:SUMF1/EgtB/PvdO family nonheme iron enzyme [candidate division KSB1 bacterium]
MIDIALVAASVIGEVGLTELVNFFKGNKSQLQKAYEKAFQNTIDWYEKNYGNNFGKKNNRFFDHGPAEAEFAKLLLLRPEPDIGLISRIELADDKNVPLEVIQAFVKKLRHEMASIRECEAILVEREKFNALIKIKDQAAKIVEATEDMRDDVHEIKNALVPSKKKESTPSKPLNWQKLHDAFLRRGLEQVSIKHVGGGFRGPEWLKLNDVFFELDAGKRSFNIGILKHKKVAGRGGLKNLERYAEVIGDHLWHFTQEHRDVVLRKIDFEEKEHDNLFYQILEAVDQALQHESLLVDPIEFRKLIDSLAKKIKQKPEEILATLHQVIEATIQRTPVLDLLNSPCSALLIGDAGMGKTTAMRRLALKLFEQLQAGSDEKIPIPLFVRLDKIANFMKEDQPLDQARQSLFSYICEHWQPDLSCKDDLCVEAIESNERPIQLILDGLDEIPSAKLRLKLAEVAKRLHENELFHIIITSRPTAINSALVKALGFQDFKLLDLTSKQITDFVHKFFNIYHGKNEGAGQEDAHAFQQALDNSEAAQEFAANPLYLTIMILMHKKHTVLPKKRLQLYAEFYEMLLLQRATDPSLGKMADKPVFEVADYKGETILWGVEDYSPLLQHIAFLTHSDDQDSVSISPERVLNAMAERGLQVDLKSMSEKDFAGRFLQFADNNLGILIYRGEFFGFSHRSLQEYLAARHLSNFDLQQVMDFWSGRVLKKPDRWLEVTRLLFCEIRSRQSFLKTLENQWLHDINDTKDARAIHTIGAILSDLEGFFERSGVIRPLHQSVTGALTRRRDRSHDQPPLFLACGDALGLMNEPAIDPMDPPMVLLNPEQPFMMGSEEYSDTKPIHPVQLSPDWIGKYPVTNKEFAEFIKAGGYEDEKYWSDQDSRDFLRKELKEKLPLYWLYERFGRSRPLAPVVGISWYEAMAYCNWLTEKNPGKKFRLPTEAEREFAARGFANRKYPWGDTLPNATLLNFYGSKLEQTTAVGSYPPASGATHADKEEEKLFDLAGNVYEWCWDWYDESYYQHSPEKNPMGPKSGARRVLRGGSWNLLEDLLSCSIRYWLFPVYRYLIVGFRVSCGA